VRPCLRPGCPQLVDAGYCKEHRSAEHRGSSAARGYDSVWERFRAWFVRRHPICADCSIKPTKEVHHVRKLRDYPELRLVESNCMGLCKACHAIRTARGE
jgi:5-methylcytosine-specific restriction enzyme A